LAGFRENRVYNFGHSTLGNLHTLSWSLQSTTLYTVTKSEPNEASLWKIAFQKRGNSHVNTGTFIPPPHGFYTFFCAGKVFPSMDGNILFV
jgi:hypothetical protein